MFGRYNQNGTSSYVEDSLQLYKVWVWLSSTNRLLKKSDADLPNLFPSLARRFACCQSCSVSLCTLWAYGSGESHPEGLGLDGLREQSAKL